MNAIDKMLAYVAPQAALRRDRARRALLTLRKYDGADSGRRTGGWISSGTSADAEIAPAAAKLRNRSRDLVRNNPYGSRACDIWVSSLIGTGIYAKVGTAQDAWTTWMTQCDADGQLDFYGLQALVGRTMFESGECLVRFRERRPEDGLVVPLQLQVLEPDYLDNLKNTTLPNGGWIRGGIEFDPIGRRAAYWLFGAHPGEPLAITTTLESKRVPAEQVLHIYERKRPGQNRGVPRLTPAILKMRDLDDYEEAELVRKGIEACFAAFVTSDEDGNTLGPTTADGDNRVESMSAGMIEYLRPGQSVTFGQPSPTDGYGDYTKTQLRAIAMACGVTYEQLTGDLSDVNYSSIRAGMVEFYRLVDQVQWLTIIPMFLAPVYRRWADIAYALQVVRGARTEALWTPPRRQWVDPEKEVGAARSEVGAAITSLSEVIRQRGEDPETVFAEIAAERAKLSAMGITSDAVMAAAAAVDSTKPAAAKRLQQAGK